MLRFFRYFVFVTSFLVLINCAKRGNITGGPKDEEPPKLLRATPPNLSTNFKAKEIRLNFDELVTIGDPQQILVSPPLNNPLEIKPQGLPSKNIKIKILDTLLPNTTYTINFRNSIKDYNEKNAFEFFQYVFSTGSVLDSLTFRGNVKDAFKQKLGKNISVFLYEDNETYTDSMVYKSLPRYVANTSDTTNFNFSYLKEGKYRILALKDVNSNYKFDPKEESIGFIEKSIQIPEDTIVDLSIFREIPEFKFTRAKQISKHKFQIGFVGEIESPKIEILGEFPDTLTFKTRLFKDEKRDTLNYWVKPFFKQDSIIFLTTSGLIMDTIVSRYKDQFKDSLVVKYKSNTLRLKEDFEITANTPLDSVDISKIKLFDQDTLPIEFKPQLDRLKNKISFDFPKRQNRKFRFQFFPGAITDFIGNKNDTISILASTLEQSAYGTLRLTISNRKNKSPIIIQLVSNDKVEIESILTYSQSSYHFKDLTPNNYIVRVIEDINENGKWDTGNFLNKVQPEKVYYYSEPINIRANWDVNQEVLLE